MARKIKDMSISSHRTGDNLFTAEFCNKLEKNYYLQKPKNSYELTTKLEQVFRFYESDKFLLERQPTSEETREVYNYIKYLSKNLHETIEKLSFGQRLGLARMTQKFSLTDLDKTEEYLKRLENLSLVAGLESKGKPSPPKINASLKLFCSGVAEVYKLFSEHRGRKKGATKIEFCVECCDKANIKFRLKGSKSDDIDRMKKILNPSRLSTATPPKIT